MGNKGMLSYIIVIFISAIDSWWPPFKTFLTEKRNMSWNEINDDQHFKYLLSDFLFDVDNAKQQASFKFSSPLECGKPAPTILVGPRRY